MNKKARGNPSFKPRWKGKTRPVRVPEQYADLILDFARKLDNQTLSPELYKEWIENK